MISDFNEEAQEILTKAKLEMLELKHPYVGTEHLVLAILHTQNEFTKKLEKFNMLYKLVTNQFNTFFNKIDIGIAFSILEDIGIEQDKLEETYQKLMQEEVRPNYTLVDVDLNNKEEER